MKKEVSDLIEKYGYTKGVLIHFYGDDGILEMTDEDADDMLQGLSEGL